MTLKLVLSETLLADCAEVICLICLTHEQVGIRLEITRPRARGGDSWPSKAHGGIVHSGPSHHQSWSNYPDTRKRSQINLPGSCNFQTIQIDISHIMIILFVCAKYECCWNSCRVKKALRRLVASGVLVAVWHQHMCFLDSRQRKVECWERGELRCGHLDWREGREEDGQKRRRLEPELWRERWAANSRRHSDTGDTQK